MDRRTLLALLLTAIVIVATPMLFPSPRRPAVDTAAVNADTTRRGAIPPAPAAQQPAESPGAARALARPAPTAAQTPVVRAETTVVTTPRASYAIASPGGAPVSVSLPQYASLRAGATANAPVQLIESGDRLFHLRLTNGRDTIAFDSVAFRAQPVQRGPRAIVQPFTSVSTAAPITLTYTFPVDSFVVHVDGSIASATAGSWQLLVTLPTRIKSEEANLRDDITHLSVAYKRRADDVTSVNFRQLDTLTRADTGAIRWIAERNKYFIVVVVPERRGGAVDSTFRAVQMRAGPRAGKDATAAHATGVLPATDGRFAFTLFAGPQLWDHLRRTAPDLENVNPYGGWLHGVVQPFSALAMRLLLWLHHTLNVSYGWVLVILGVVIRLLLWPLNQRAMRSSMVMQRLQPELQEIQQKYKNDPEKQREATMKLWQQHGMSPFTPLMGCLPMLLPMPILFALYFALTNTIELRGVPFLWLPDLSLRDPYFITPLFLGATMFLTSWIGMRGMPPNPQSKMMAYVMPIMFTAIFWNFASGVNLYYAVQNVAALPQQWLLARERAAQAPLAARTEPAVGGNGARAGSGGGRRSR
ncbi:MAG TPA: membrane protein insertase YidC [Gemmatimonadaceae bacterium]|nr:membrane protein insertase YidC [Gemmatimonadaceae bacterium]